jgi:hypothetical protein
MPLAFLLDEHLRGPLWNAIQRHDLASPFRLDVARVGDPSDLPLGSDDDAILDRGHSPWACALEGLHPRCRI